MKFLHQIALSLAFFIACSFGASGQSIQPVLVKDIALGTTSSFPTQLVAINNTLFFESGGNLWKSNGRQDGTLIVASDVNPSDMIGVGNRLFFYSPVGSFLNATGMLWTSDGTKSKTFSIKDITPSGLASSFSSHPLVHVNGSVFFRGIDGANGGELWKSDGTPNGTAIVKDINTGRNYSDINNLTPVNDKLFFTANDGTHGNALWRSNGTAAGTHLMVYGATPKNLTNAGALVYYAFEIGFANMTGGQLWKSYSNSNEEGGYLVKKFSPFCVPENLKSINEILYFTVDDSNYGKELWKSDGTERGTVLVKDINIQIAQPSGGPGKSNPKNLTEVNGSLYFAADNGLNGIELWKSDGTESGTVMVKNINPNGSSDPENLFCIGSTLYFTASNGTAGRELWKSDGTSGGTLLIKDINPGPSDSSPKNLTDVNGALFFTANDGTNGVELWTLPGTPINYPEIAIEYPLGTSLTNNLSSVSCGNVDLNSSNGTTAITIRNLGTANLSGLSILKSGPHAADFLVSNLGISSLSPTGATSFTVTFAPSAAGPRNATILIASNDDDETPFVIQLTGTGVAVDHFALTFDGAPFTPRVGNQLTLNLKRLANAGETIKVSGIIPSGLKFNAATGLLTGIIAGKPGTYQTVVQVLQGKTVVRNIAFPITVLEFPTTLIGSFDFLVEDSNSVPSGVCKITITGANKWSATLESAGASKKRSAKGTFILAEGSPIATITALFPAITGASALTVDIPIDGSTPTITGTYNGGTLRGFRIAKVGETPPATVAYNLVLDAGEQDGINVPAGLGWMKGKVSNKGIGTFKGLLGDGTAASLTLRLSPSGQAILWSQPYKNKNSYIGGIVTLPNLDQPANANEKLADRLWWSKAPDLKTLSYPDGFPGMPVTVGTSRWTAPSSATAMGSSLGWRDNSKAKVTIDGGGLSNQETQSTAASLPTEFTLDDKFNLVTSALASTPLVAWKGKVSKTDGAITGTLTIPAGFSSDFPSGSAAVSGVLVQDDPWGTTTGCGQIKVPASGPKGSFKTAAIVLGQ